VSLEAGQTLTVDVTLNPSRVTESVVVTARRVEEVAQEVPIPVSVVSGNLVADTGAFNVNRLKELIPTVQFYSTNPRNSSINIRVRGQLLLAPSDRIGVTFAVDYTRQRPEGYTQVVAGVAPTLRPANRQFAQIAADLGYTVPSLNAFDRRTDVDTPLRSYQDL